METREQAKEKLRIADHRKPVYLNWFEEGGAEVFKVNDVYVLFEVPQYGGEPNYEGSYFAHNLDEMLDLIYSWT